MRYVGSILYGVPRLCACWYHCLAGRRHFPVTPNSKPSACCNEVQTKPHDSHATVAVAALTFLPRDVSCEYILLPNRYTTCNVHSLYLHSPRAAVLRALTLGREQLRQRPCMTAGGVVLTSSSTHALSFSSCLMLFLDSFSVFHLRSVLRRSCIEPLASHAFKFAFEGRTAAWCAHRLRSVPSELVNASFCLTGTLLQCRCMIYHDHSPHVASFLHFVSFLSSRPLVGSSWTGPSWNCPRSSKRPIRPTHCKRR